MSKIFESVGGEISVVRSLAQQLCNFREKEDSWRSKKE